MRKTKDFKAVSRDEVKPLGEPPTLITEGDEDPFFHELRRTLDLTWEDDFFDAFQDDFQDDDIVAVFDVDYERLTTFETAKLWGILCTMMFVVPHVVIPGLLLCTPWSVRRNARWCAQATHVALTKTHILKVIDKHRIWWGCCHATRTIEKIPLTAVSTLTFHEHLRDELSCCYKEAPHVAHVAITTPRGAPTAHPHELIILGLEHNDKFIQALIAIRRHAKAKELQNKTSTSQLLAALNKVVNLKSRFPRWKTFLEPIENELVQLAQATRRIARIPAQAIKVNPLQSSSNTSSCMEKHESHAMEKQESHAIPKLQFEMMDPLSEIEMVEARSTESSIFDAYNDASSIGSTVYSGQPIPDILESPESLDLVWIDTYFEDREDVAAVFDFDRERLKTWYISSGWCMLWIYIVAPLNLVLLLCFRMPYLSRYADLAAKAPHLAISRDGLVFVEESHPSVFMVRRVLTKRTKLVFLDKIVDISIEESPQRRSCSWCWRRKNLSKASIYAGGRSGALELEGLTDPHSLKMLILTTKCARSDFGNYAEIVEAVRQVCLRISKRMDNNQVSYLTSTLEVLRKDLQMQNNLLGEMESYLFQQDMV